MTVSNLEISLIGRASNVRTIRVEPGQLKFFAKVTDQRDPIYFDEEAARAAGHRGLPAPPTFAFSLALAFPDQAGFALTQVDRDLRYLLHAEQGFRNYAPIYGGDEIALRTQIADIYEKKNGALFFLEQRTELTDPSGRLCVECRTKYVIRSPEQ